MNGNYPAGVTGNEGHFNPSYEDKCCQCGEIIADTEHDHHGISLDGEKRVCSGCLMSDVARLGSISINDGYFATAIYEGEEVQSAILSSEQEALKRAAELAEYAWAVKAFVEVN